MRKCEGPMFPKPRDSVKKIKPPVKTYKGGREVCNLNTKHGHDEYNRRKKEMHDRQKGICPLCNKYIAVKDMSFDHYPEKRRMGAGFRDDRIWIDGKENNRVLHFWCNSALGSKREEDEDLDNILFA